MRRLRTILRHTLTLVSLSLFTLSIIFWIRSKSAWEGHFATLGYAPNVILCQLGYSDGNFGIAIDHFTIPLEHREAVANMYRDQPRFGFDRWSLDAHPSMRNSPSHWWESFDLYQKTYFNNGGLPGVHLHRNGLAAPFWSATLVFAILPLLHLVRFIRRHKPVAGLCPQCQYDLRASPDRCPECGTIPVSKD